MNNMEKSGLGSIGVKSEIAEQLARELTEGRVVGRHQRRFVQVALHKMRSQDAILFYERPAYCLSNFSSHVIDFEVMGIMHIFMTCEHAYQASKFTDKEIINKICYARSAYQAKKFAHEHKDQYRPDWCDEFKLDVMDRITKAKLEQHHDEIAPLLFASGTKVIVENSSQDSFWGWGKDRKGLNWLGEFWMRRRTELRQNKRGLRNV
jgi:ribA/ribD-fused uncharacterized protein